MADMNTIGGLHYEIMRRCYNPKSVMYKSYGAVGITVCDEWHDREVFRKWCLENGWDKLSPLKRFDIDKPYCPKNCYFGDPREKSDTDWSGMRKRAKENKKKKAEIGIKKLIDHPLYSVYTSMHTRCENPNHMQYRHYGGRGIKICKEWCGKNGSYNFIKWGIENGWKSGLTLDRIDNNKGYSPNNCRWVTMEEQINNRNVSRRYLYKGEVVTIKDVCSMTGLKYQSLYNKVKNLENMTSIDSIVEKMI